MGKLKFSPNLHGCTSRRLNLKTLLLSTVATTTALMLVPPNEAQADCLLSGTTVTCSGQIYRDQVFADVIPQPNALNINSTANFSTGARGTAGLLAVINGVGDINLDSTGSFLNFGRDSAAVALLTETGNITVSNKATLSPVGFNSVGIFAGAVWGNVDITNSGDMVPYTRFVPDGPPTITTGPDGILGTPDDEYRYTGKDEPVATEIVVGIRVRVDTGDINIENSGKLTAVGNGNEGIVAQVINGNVTLTNTGEMSMTAGGVDDPTYSGALRATSNNGNVVINNTANGVFDTGRRAAIVGASASGNVDITHAGDLTVSGRAAAIEGSVFDGLVKITTTSGNIIMSGNSSVGILASTVDGMLSRYYKEFGTGSVHISNAAKVSANGEGGVALLGYSRVGTTRIDNTAELNSKTSGVTEFRGWQTYDDGFDATSTGIFGISHGAGVLINNSGNILAADVGINALVYDFVPNNPSSRYSPTFVFAPGDAVVNNAGKITINPANVVPAWSSIKHIGINAYAQHGNVVVDNSGMVKTLIAGSTGILAVSDLGSSTITNSGGVETTKENSPGIVAISNKSIRISTSGSINVSGNGSVAIVTNPVAALTNSFATINVTNGTVMGNRAAIEFGAGGGVLNNAGILSTLSNNTILGSGQAEKVNNAGSIIGNIMLGDGANVFNNQSGGVVTAAKIHVGAGNSFNNAGNFDIAGNGVIGTTTLTGNFVQNASGRLLVDVNHATGASDVLKVNGTASLAGDLIVGAIDLPTVDTNFTIIETTGGVTGTFGTLLSTSGFLVEGAAINAGMDYQITTKFGFRPGEILDPQTRQAATIFNQILFDPTTSPELRELLVQTARTSSGNLKKAVKELQPDGVPIVSAANQQSNASFANSMLSCRAYDGEFRFVREQNCSWMRASTRFGKGDVTANRQGYDEKTFGVSGGFQNQIDGNLFGGLALSYENTKIDTTGGVTSKADRLQLGGVLKYRMDNTVISSAVSAGRSWAKTSRAVAGRVAKSSPDAWFGSAHFRISNLIELGEINIKPILDGGISYVSRKGFRETGAGGANLTVAKGKHTSFTIHPMIEINTENQLDDGAVLRPYAVAGLLHFLDDRKYTVSSSFTGAPAGIVPFKNLVTMDKTFFTLDVGADLLTANGWVVRGQYSGKFSTNSRLHGGSLKASYKF